MTFLKNFSLFQIFIIIAWVDIKEEGANVFLHAFCICMTVSYILKTSYRGVGNHSGFLMKNPDLPEVSRIQGIRNSLIYTIMHLGVYIMLPYQFLEILINMHHEWSFKTKFLFYIKALRFKKILLFTSFVLK